MPAGPLTRRRKTARHAVRAARVIAAVATGLALWRGGEVLFGWNLGTVEPGLVYRSGQLSAHDLARLVDQLGLRTVVNLRGCTPAPWHEAEVSACAAAGVRHYDLSMSARELPEPETVLRLLDVIREAPRPLLIHCKSGADRAGLASAICLIEDEQLKPDAARAAGLTPWRGHLPVASTDELDRFLTLYERHGAGKSLEQWTREDYLRIFMHEWRPARPLL